MTALTVQNTHNASACWPTASALLEQQFDSLCADISFQAIKIGLLPNREVTETIARLINTLAPLPIIFDPVLGAGGGAQFSNDLANTVDTMQQLLLPLVDVILPNTIELRQLCNLPTNASLAQCCAALVDHGCKNVFVTGGHEDNPDTIINRWFTRDGLRMEYPMPRLAGQFHGSGCTLAASCSAHLALGKSYDQAFAAAQRYTWETLHHAYRIGGGQSIPQRLLANKNLSGK